MPNVLIVNYGTHDYTKAERFGQLVPMSKGPVNKFKLSAMHRLFEERIEHLTSAKDFILVSGPMIMNVIACAMFARKHGCLNLLIWKEDEQTGTGDYLCRKITL